MLKIFPQCQFSLKFPEILSKNHKYAIIDWVCLGFPTQCIVGYSLTCSIRSTYMYDAHETELAHDYHFSTSLFRFEIIIIKLWLMLWKFCLYPTIHYFGIPRSTQWMRLLMTNSGNPSAKSHHGILFFVSFYAFRFLNFVLSLSVVCYCFNWRVWYFQSL